MYPRLGRGRRPLSVRFYCCRTLNGDAPHRAAGETCFRYLVGALTAGPQGRLVGPDAGPFCAFLDSVVSGVGNETVSSAMILLRTILQQPSDLSAEQRGFAGRAARSLLAFAWCPQDRNPPLVTHALRSVCETFTSNSVESTELLRKCIEPQQLKSYGYEEIHAIARYIRDIATLDASFAADLYGEVFAWDEPSQERPTSVTARSFP